MEGRRILELKCSGKIRFLTKLSDGYLSPSKEIVMKQIVVKDIKT